MPVKCADSVDSVRLSLTVTHQVCFLAGTHKFFMTMLVFLCSHALIVWHASPSTGRRSVSSVLYCLHSVVHISVYVRTNYLYTVLPCCICIYVGLCAFDYIRINANINTIYVTLELNVWTTVSLVPDILHFMLFNDTSVNNSPYVFSWSMTQGNTIAFNRHIVSTYGPVSW